MRPTYESHVENQVENFCIRRQSIRPRGGHVVTLCPIDRGVGMDCNPDYPDFENSDKIRTFTVESDSKEIHIFNMKSGFFKF